MGHVPMSTSKDAPDPLQKRPQGQRIKDWFLQLSIFRRVLSGVIAAGTLIAAVYTLYSFGHDVLDWLRRIPWSGNSIITISVLLLGLIFVLTLILFCLYAARPSLALKRIVVTVISVGIVDFSVLMCLLYTRSTDIPQQLMVAFFHEGAGSNAPPPEAYNAAMMAFSDVLKKEQEPILKYMSAESQLGGVGGLGSRQFLAIIAATDNPPRLMKNLRKRYGDCPPVVLSIIPTLSEYFDGDPYLGTSTTCIDTQLSELISYAAKQKVGPILVVYSDTINARKEADQCEELARENGLVAVLVSGRSIMIKEQVAEVIEIIRRCGSIILLLSRDDAVSFCNLLTSSSRRFQGIVLLPSRLLCEKIKQIQKQTNLKMLVAVASYLSSPGIRKLEQRMGHNMTPIEADSYLAASLVAEAIRVGVDKAPILAKHIFSHHDTNIGLVKLGLDSLDFSDTHTAILKISVLPVQ